MASLEKGFAGFERMTSRASFSDMVIEPLRFFGASGGVPGTLLQLDGVSATPMTPDGISATPLKTMGVSVTPVQLGGVLALKRTILVIGFFVRQSTFPSSVLQKNSDLPALRPALRPIQTNLRPNQTTLHPIQTIPSVILVWV